MSKIKLRPKEGYISEDEIDKVYLIDSGVFGCQHYRQGLTVEMCRSRRKYYMEGDKGFCKYHCKQKFQVDEIFPLPKPKLKLRK